MSKYFERQEAAELKADQPMWDAFWQNYVPLQTPPPPRRPSPTEIAAYLREHPEAAMA